jgi:methyl-accepting chemotaxis protein
MRRALGLAGMILGVIGIVINLALIPVIWIGHAALDDAIVAVAETATTPLQEATQATSDLSSTVQQVRERVQRASAQASQAAQSDNVGAQVGQQLAAALDDVLGPEYVRLRESYTALRERVATAVSGTQRLRRILPIGPQPDLPVAELAALDQNLMQVDATLRQLRSGELPNNGQLVSGAVARVAQGLQTVDAAIGQVSQRIDGVQARLIQAQATVEQTESAARTVSVVAAIVFTVLCLYGVLLHAALFVSSRGWRTQVPAAVPSGTPPRPDSDPASEVSPAA